MIPPFVLDAANLDAVREWSFETFGPQRGNGVVDHIRKELVEIEETDYTDMGEWVDVIILGFDGACRAGHDSQAILDAIRAKQIKNMGRTWPDWRTVDPGKAIEHDRSKEGSEVSS